MVEAPKAEQRGVQVGDLDAILHHLQTQFVGLTDAGSASMPPPASHLVKGVGVIRDRREPAGVMMVRVSA